MTGYRFEPELLFESSLAPDQPVSIAVNTNSPKKFQQLAYILMLEKKTSVTNLKSFFHISGFTQGIILK